MQRKRHVATRAHVLEEPQVLKDRCHAPPEARQKAAPAALEPKAVYADAARAWPQVTMNELQEGCLAGFARAGYEDELARRDGQADFFDCDKAPIAPAHPSKQDERSGILVLLRTELGRHALSLRLSSDRLHPDSQPVACAAARLCQPVPSPPSR